ncbi:MAG: phospholipase D family protein [Acidiferrobacterales bacterium]
MKIKKKLAPIFLAISLLLVSACAQLPVNNNTNPSYAYRDTGKSSLEKKASAWLKKSHDKSAMFLLDEGTGAFLARMALLIEAERSIDVQYYIWRADLTGKLFYGEMIKAADRGVRVRVLLDDISITSENEAMLYAMDKHKNIEVRLFNPFASRGFRLADYLTDASRINRRMHNKSFTVDGQYTVVGGRNIGNEYFSADEESNFRDLDVLSVGKIVRDVEKQFDAYWNSKIVYPIKLFTHNQSTTKDLEKLTKELSEFGKAQEGSKYDLDIQDSELYKYFENELQIKNYKKLFSKLFSGDVLVLYDDPEKGLGKSKKEVVFLKSLLKPHLDKVTNRFEMISPYFVPGSRGTKYLSSLVKQGIKVRVITNSLSSTDGIMAQSGYARQRLNLLKGGIELYELKAEEKTRASRSLRRGGKAKSGLHAKTYIFDRKEIFIGSFNFDPRSAYINTEVGILYQIPEMARLIGSAVFDDDLKEFTYRLELVTVDEIDDEGIESRVEKIYWVETINGKEIRYDVDPKTSAWRRFNEDIYSILPIESQL